MKKALRKSSGKVGHGGRRDGAGNKKGNGFYDQKPFSIKFTQAMVQILNTESKEKNKSISNLIRTAVYEKYHPMASFTK